MLHRISFQLSVFLIAIIALTALQKRGHAQETRLNSNDISFLWPLPQRVADLTGLISLDEKLVGDAEIWPLPVFQQILATAPGVPLANGQSGIEFPVGEDVEKLTSWKIAGIRIDPSAPGCDPSLTSKFGSTPQIRLVVQPIFSKAGQFRVHDIAAHLAFDLSEGPGKPDKVAFLAVAKDLVALKGELATLGVTTDDRLGVHPGFTKPGADLPGKLREFLKKHLKPQNLNAIAFMGIRRPEPWIFFLMRKGPTGFVVSPQRNSGNNLAEMLIFPNRVVPAPATTTFGALLGVSTTPLLDGQAALEAEVSSVTIPLIGRPIKFKDVPDVIANPRISNVLNTNCISCHTESSIRVDQAIASAGEPLAFKGPGAKPEVLPQDMWNVRNFGWGVGISGKMATATMRTAHEATESAEFINRVYLTSAPAPAVPPAPNPAIPATTAVKPVANALTLIVTAKSPEDYEKLKGKITHIQSLPPEANPIVQALEKLEKVHFARFVFIDKSKTLMVITTFDDDFDTYIDLFVDKIGGVFNIILAHVEDAPPLPVEQHRAEFNKFIRDHDAPIAGTLYSAYPKLRASDIKTLSQSAK